MESSVRAHEGRSIKVKRDSSKTDDSMKPPRYAKALRSGERGLDVIALFVATDERQTALLQTGLQRPALAP
jgi:hypothetical protein